MKELIIQMINKAEYYNNLNFVDEKRELMSFIKELINELGTTINCPSDWRDIGTELALEYKGSWVYEELELYNWLDV